MNKNIYHRYVKLPFEHKFPDCFKAKPENMRGENWHEWCATREHWDERFVDWLKEYGLKPSNVCEAFYNGPNGGGLPMHNDAPTLNNSSNINFTWGPQDSIVRWYKVKDESLIQTERDNTDYHKEVYFKDIDIDIPVDKFYHAEVEDCDVVHEAVISQPSLLNVGQLHSTHNFNTNEPRWTLSYHLLTIKDNTHIQFEDALDLFKDLAYESN